METYFRRALAADKVTASADMDRPPTEKCIGKAVATMTAELEPNKTMQLSPALRGIWFQGRRPLELPDLQSPSQSEGLLLSHLYEIRSQGNDGGAGGETPVTG